MPIRSASPGGCRRYPLYVHLSALFSALVLGAGSAIAWLGYIEQRDTGLANAAKLFGHIAREAQWHVNEALQPVRRFAEILVQEPIVHASERYADRFLPSEQVDEVDVAQHLS
jgi:hypothetical protein